MQENQQQLMKYFSLVLKRRASLDNAPTTIDPKILGFLSRKDLVAIIQHRYKGKLPEGVDLVAMENEGLLAIIEDELYIITYVLQQWCTQQSLSKTSVSTSKTPPLSPSKESTPKTPQKHGK